MKSRYLCAGLIASLIMPAADSAEVLDLRTGYWEFTWNLPDVPPTRELLCLTPEHLELLRFFSTRDPNCHYFEGGQQTRTTWYAQASCAIEGVTGIFKYDLVASDAMTFHLTTTVTAEDQSATGHATARWLQEACDTSSIPIA